MRNVDNFALRSQELIRDDINLQDVKLVVLDLNSLAMRPELGLRVLTESPLIVDLQFLNSCVLRYQYALELNRYNDDRLQNEWLNFYGRTSSEKVQEQYAMRLARAW